MGRDTAATDSPAIADIRQTAAWQQLRRELGAHWANTDRPCAQCGKPIEWDADWRHPDAYQLDHIIPVSRGGAPLATTNVQPMHRRCNIGKHNRSTGKPSREW